ncbi:MAG: acetylxylan esterase [Lentisphaeria bacterium]|nr:acetylxylan esterase [Lentisphaeria bacterium]
MKHLFYTATVVLILAGCTPVSSEIVIEKPRKSEMLQDYYISRVEKNMEQTRRAVAKAGTRQDALRLVESARKKVQASFKNVKSLLPVESRCTGVANFPGYKVEKHLIRTRENFSMSVNLFLPDKGKKPFPAIIFLAGHATNGKSGYLRACVNFALRGFAVLSADPIHQGERWQFEKYSMVHGHNILNRQLLTLGENFSDWRLHDAVQLVNFLQSRSDIDHARIGVNGNSGGGTMTALLSAYDRRIAASAPSCYITTFYHNALNELPTDGEQNPASFIANKGEMLDLVLAHAPKPYRILAQQHDFFDIRGALMTYNMAKKIYRLLGAEENISITVAPHGHGYSEELRSSAYEFFGKHFNVKCDPKEEAVKLPAHKELWCSATGQLLDLPGESSVQNIIAKRALELKKQRAQKKVSPESMKKQLTKLLALPARINTTDHILLQHVRNRQRDLFLRTGIRTEPGITATLYGIYNRHNVQGNAKFSSNVELLVPESGCYDVLPGLMPLDPKAELRGIDYRGCGESQVYGGFHANYQLDYHYSALGLMMDEPLLGRRVLDVLAAIKFLHSQGVKKITLRSEGLGVIPAVFAAVLSDIPVKLHLDKKVPTYTEHALSPDAPFPQSFVPNGILKLTDLDELIELFPERFIKTR